MPSTASRYAHIDAMRAIAVLLVIWMHTSEVFVPIAAPSVQDRLYEVAHSFDFGRIGVVVFFIISGFVIPASLRGPRAVGCYQFLIRRLFRLYPLYWLSIPFGLLTTWWLWGKEISLESILWNLSMVQEAAGHPSVQGLYWTLQTELIFYGLCVALYAIGLLHSALALSLVVTVFGGFTALAWGWWMDRAIDPLRYPSASAFAYRSSEPDVLGRTGASCPRTRHLAQAGDAGHDRIRGGLDYRWPAGGRTAYAGPTQ